MARATLAGIGVASFVGSVLTAIAFELWFQRVLEFCRACRVSIPRDGPSGVVGGIGIVLGAMWARLRAQPSSLEFAAP